MSRRLALAAVIVLTSVSCGSGGSSEPSDPGTGATASSTAPSSSARSGPAVLAARALSLPTRRPSDLDLFMVEGLYPEASPMVLSPDPIPSEKVVRAELEAFLAEQGESDPDRVASGLALFDDPSLVKLAPDAVTRAAVAGLTGSLFEPAIEHLLGDDRYVLVRFGTLPDQSIVGASAGGSTGRVITINRNYANEDFRLLIPVIGHEILHDDLSTSWAEEALLNTLSALDHIRILVDHPELARRGTALSRSMNTLALVLLQSRERGSADLRIVARSGTGVAPGSTGDQPDYWSWMGDHLHPGLPRSESSTTPAPAPLAQIFDALDLPSPRDFSRSTAEAFVLPPDRWHGSEARLRVAVLLGLVDVDEIAETSGLTAEETVDTFQLDAYLRR